MPNKSSRMAAGKKRDLLFYFLVMLFPVVQFCVFYIAVNGNSILMAFQRIDIESGAVTWTLDNMKNAFSMMTTSPRLLGALKMSVVSYLLILLIGTPLGLLFSYYIYKKQVGHAAFKVFLFLPSIISAIVMVTIFQFFVERAVPAFANQWLHRTIKGLLENTQTRFPTIIFYNIWVGFGTGTLMYSNAMSSIDPEIVEAAHVDGATGFREFWHVVFPMIFPTFTTFMVTGVAGLFTNQLNLFSFYGVEAPGDLITYGYYLYTQTQAAASEAEYPLLSAMGIILTVVTVAITFLVKRLLEKHGPSVD